jgi:putative copper export protein
MQMSPSARKFMLTAHVVSSVAWFGALLVFLAHSVASLVSGDPNLVRSVCIAMALTAWFVILPLSLASFVTGVVQALGTAWGLVRHYWVVAKLLLTASATAVLLLKLSPISDLAAAASLTTFNPNSATDLKQMLLVHSIGGLAVLLVIAVLAIYKPAGLTPLAGQAVRVQGASALSGSSLPKWLRMSLIVAMSLAFVLALLLMHGGHGPSMHSLHTP